MVRELTKSVLGFSWALSLFGLRQVTRLIASPVSGQAAQPGLYAVTQAAEDQLNDLVWAAFQSGDELQRDAVDVLFDTVTLRAFTPSYVRRLATSLVQQSQETGRVLAPGANSRLAWQEIKNKYEVYNLVKNVRELLAIPEGAEFPLADLIEKAYALGAYPDLWAVEGLGHDYAMAFWKPPATISDLLTGERASVLPEKSLTMMHAGLGLAFAEQLLKTVTPYSPAGEIRRALEEFITLCRENSRDGYVGAAYESLGLVARTWHAQMMGVIDRALQETAPEIVGYFWHGAGRALYFLPIHFVPGSPSPWRAAKREAAHEASLLNLLAGLTWATTLVNLRQPEIMANLLKFQGDDPASSRAISNGVMSSLIMGYDITPGDVYIREFCRYRPDPSDVALAGRWRDLVARPCADALDRYYPALNQRRRLGEVFHYQTWDGL